MAAEPRRQDRPFVVLIGTKMPAILVEISALSNEEEVKLLTKENYRENIALALSRAIKNYARNFKLPVRKAIRSWKKAMNPSASVSILDLAELDLRVKRRAHVIDSYVGWRWIWWRAKSSKKAS